ncbi:MAG: helix-turn-helix domain-containing protein, partial [Pirellulales bacterium]|nr:helix-turn-helix domain-containing protein [Pirellulales bacterium]
AVAEEVAARDENAAAAKDVAPELLREAQFRIAVVRQLREAREAAGISLSELEMRTGIQKSALSRLENSKSPNPTLATLRRYANAVGVELHVSIGDSRSDQSA